MADIGERWRWRRRGQTRVAPSFHPAVQRQYDEETEEREASLYDGADVRLLGLLQQRRISDLTYRKIANQPRYVKSFSGKRTGSAFANERDQIWMRTVALQSPTGTKRSNLKALGLV